MTTGAAMAATGTDFSDLLSPEGEDDAVLDPDVDKVDNGAGVMGAVEGVVLLSWSVILSM